MPPMPKLLHMADMEMREANAASRLLASLHTAYVRNRNEEMDRIDRSTGWSVALLTLVLSFAFTSNLPYYFIPLSLFFVFVFCFKEARRYVYYIFWSHKEFMAERLFKKCFTTNIISTERVLRLIEEVTPTAIIPIENALKVRFYRSYYWMIVIIFVATLLLALEQSALSDARIVSIFFISFVLLALVTLHGFEEIIMPRRKMLEMRLARKRL